MRSIDGMAVCGEDPAVTARATLITFVAIVLSLSGCGGDSSPSSPRASVDEELRAEYPEVYESTLDVDASCEKLQELFDQSRETARALRDAEQDDTLFRAYMNATLVKMDSLGCYDD
jgi:hypothetical protein